MYLSEATVGVALCLFGFVYGPLNSRVGGRSRCMLALQVTQPVVVIPVKKISSGSVGGVLAFGESRGHSGGEGRVLLDKAFLAVTVFTIPGATEAPDGTMLVSELGANGDRVGGWGSRVRGRGGAVRHSGCRRGPGSVATIGVGVVNRWSLGR